VIADSAPEYPERMTRDMILEAASREIERNGMTQFRIKRVPRTPKFRWPFSIATSTIERPHCLRDRAPISPSAVGSRRDIHAAVSRRVDDRRSAPSDARDHLRGASSVAYEARIQRIESMSFARHNPTASAGIAEAKKETASMIVERVRPLQEMGCSLTV